MLEVIARPVVFVEIQSNVVGLKIYYMRLSRKKTSVLQNSHTNLSLVIRSRFAFTFGLIHTTETRTKEISSDTILIYMKKAP